MSVAAIAVILLYLGTDGFTSMFAGGGSGAPTDAQYVTLAVNGDLTAERVLTGTANQVIVTDNGAGSTVVLSLPQSIATTSDVQFDDVLITGQLNLDSSSEFIRLDPAATIRFDTRDNVIINLDTNNNTAGSAFCIRGDGSGTDELCLDEDGNITLATIDGDLNTLVDIKPDSFDSVDAGADEDCLTYEGTNTVEWQVCGSISYGDGLPIPDGSTTANTDHIGVPGHTWIGTGGGAFVVANDIYYEPFTVVNEITVNRLSFIVTSAGAAGNSCRVGVYESDDEWQPVALVVDAGQVINDTTGWKHVANTFVLAPNDYLGAIVCDSGPALGDHSASSDHAMMISSATTSGTRFARYLRDSAPTGTPHASGFADPGDSPWDTIDLGTGTHAHFLIMRWSVN